MGKIRDMCLETGQTQEQMFASNDKAFTKNLKTLVKEASYALPKPYDKRNENWPSEKDVRSSLLADLRRIPGCFCIYVQSTGVLMRGSGDTAFMGAATHTGFPDLVLGYNGRVVFCELKVPGGKVKGGQLTMLQNMRKAGMLAIIGVDPVKIKTFLLKGPEGDYPGIGGIAVV